MVWDHPTNIPNNKYTNSSHQTGWSWTLLKKKEVSFSEKLSLIQTNNSIYELTEGWNAWMKSDCHGWVVVSLSYLYPAFQSQIRVTDQPVLSWQKYDYLEFVIEVLNSVDFFFFKKDFYFWTFTLMYELF